MIKMLELIDLPVVGMTSKSLRTAITEAEESVGLTQKEMLNKKSLKKMIRSEYLALLGEVQEKYPKIEKELEEVRKSMFAEYFKRQKVGNTYLPALEQRIQVQTLSELTEIPVNELMMYAVNVLKTKNESSLIEYHLGHFRFKAL